MRGLLIDKTKATAIHLSISIVIFIGILYLILVEWYPEPFFTAEGGWNGIKLMAAVDLVLGPTLTFIIFNPAKPRKEIISDLSIIAVVQAVALVLGGYTVYYKRPVALVFYETAFYTVTSDYFYEQDISVPDFSQFSDHNPPVLGVREPETEQEKARFNALIRQLIPIYAHHYLYEPVSKHIDQISRKQINVAEIMRENKTMEAEILELTNGSIADYYYVALEAKFHNVILIMTKTGEIKGLVKAPVRK